MHGGLCAYVSKHIYLYTYALPFLLHAPKCHHIILNVHRGLNASLIQNIMHINLYAKGSQGGDTILPHADAVINPRAAYN